jgi:glycosyltransferase involved in cell wall biosynthesis
MPRVSVHMPVYNAMPYLAEAVESILAQTYGDFEFIIIDDGSTDGSGEQLAAYAARDERIRLTRRENWGITKTRNQALGQAVGEFFAVMDADDVALPDRLARQVAYFDAHPECVALGCRVLLIDADGAPIREMSEMTSHAEIDAEHLAGRGGAITHPAAMMRRDALVGVGGYREAFQTAEDLDVFLRLAECGKLANLPEVLLHYRQHAGSTCHTRQARVRADNRAVVNEARTRRGLAILENPTQVDANGAPDPASHHRKWAWWALEAGYPATARKHAWAALRRSPWAARSWRALVCALRGR